MDLHVMPVEEIHLEEDKLCVVMLDKDGVLPEIPAPSDEDYRVKKPTQNEFLACCNEFWWCLNNVAKGLWREEIPYVQQMLRDACQPQLVKLLDWKIGFETGFCVSTGKASKYMKMYLADDLWERFLKTYSSGNLEEIWDSVIVMCDLFQEAAWELEEKWGFVYNREEAEASYGFLKHVRTLPKDAKEIY